MSADLASDRPATATKYDVFISYARSDNQPRSKAYPQGWVTAIYEHIVKDHRRFSTAPLSIFFDREELREGDRWWPRIQAALKQSKMLLVCLSPNYFASEYCRREWEEYTRREVHQLLGSEGVLPVYFIEAPSMPTVSLQWRNDVLEGEKSRNWVDLRPWFPEGSAALRREEVQLRLDRLGLALWDRVERTRRAAKATGNLRRPNPRFAGRKAELQKLHEALMTGAVSEVVVLQGMGGQGKTELAVAYAHGWADAYPGGLWSLHADGATELLPLIGTLAAEPRLEFTPSENDRRDPALMGRSILQHLRKRVAEHASGEHDARGVMDDAALIILDNVSEPGLLAPSQLTSLPGGAVEHGIRFIATTRLEMRSQRALLHVIPVDSLDEESSMALIREHQPCRDSNGRIVYDSAEGEPEFANEQEKEAARQIVRLLGCHALAIEQIAVLLGIYQEIRPSNLVADLADRGLSQVLQLGGQKDIAEVTDLDGRLREDPKARHLGHILATTLNLLEPAALATLQYASLLPPDHIPVVWLRELVSRKYPDILLYGELGPSGWSAIERRLTGLRLLTHAEQSQAVRIHRLLAEVVRQQMAEDFTMVEKEVLSLISQEAVRLSSPSGWGNTSTWMVRSITLYAETLLHRTHPAGIELAVNCAEALIEHAEMSFAERLIGMALTSASLKAETNLKRISLLNSMADIMRERGRLVEAGALLQQAMHSLEQLREPDSMLLAKCLNNLGQLHQREGRLDEAAKEFHHALNVLSYPGEKSKKFMAEAGIILNNLGDLEMNRRRAPEAKVFFEQAIDALIAALEEKHPDVATALHNLGVLHCRSGRHEDAAACYQRAVLIYENIFGPAHLRVGATLADLARSQAWAGQFDAAISSMSKALRILKEVPLSDRFGCKPLEEMIEELIMMIARSGKSRFQAEVLVSAAIPQRTIDANLWRRAWIADKTARLLNIGNLVWLFVNGNRKKG